MKNKFLTALFVFSILILFAAASARAQTNSFTFQGRLNDDATAAHGSYDFQFSLYDDSNGQIGSTLTISNVNVTNGIFTVNLDFGTGAFPGAARFLEIAVKKPADPGFTILTPRQSVTSSPYAIKSQNAEISVNATQLGGVLASEFVQTTDTRLTDDRNPLPDSGFYIQNRTSQQTSTNFNIEGMGTAGSFNALLQYNLNGSRILAAQAGNTFAGINAGNLTTGNFNSFFGNLAGTQNTSGLSNSFFGTGTGLFNTMGTLNSFFGRSAGRSNTSGGSNSFFGVSAGAENTTGNSNSFIGTTAGVSNTTGFNNTLIGAQADVGAGNLNHATAIGVGAIVGTSNTIVLGRPNGFDTIVIPGRARANIFSSATEFQINDNRIIGVGGESSGEMTSLFVGFKAGEQNPTALNNSFFGYQSGGVNTKGTDNSFFGSLAGAANVSAEKNSFFGVEAGSLTTSGSFNSFFGYVAGRANTTGLFNTSIGYASGTGNRTGNMNVYLGHFSGSTPRNSTRVTLLGAFSDAFDNLEYATAIGSGAVVTTSNTIVLGRPNGADKVVVAGLGDGGDLQLCWNAGLQIARCASSLRFKTNLKPFDSGLNLVKRLQPITFDWTTNGKNDLGLGAEDVAEIEPLLVTYNEEGRIQGVKYDRLGVVLLNAVKEQQEQIENQEKQNLELKKQIAEQKILIENLRLLVCSQNREAQICQPLEEEKDEK